MQSVVITGVSTGIGHAAAKVMIARGFRVFGSVRNQADAERVQAELGDNFAPLIFDVVDTAAIAKAAASVREALGGTTLAGLVNNAGIAVSGPLLEVPESDYRKQLEVNLMGPFLVTQAFAPLLGADPELQGPPGRIVNISSVSGIRAMPFLGPYSASKFGLEGYSESLRRELMLFGIDVIVIGPGPVKTAIWDKAEDVDVEQYANSPYRPILERFQKVFISQGRDGYPADRLGELIYTALTTAKPKVRYAAVKGRKIEKLMMQVASPRMLDKAIAKMLGLAKKV
ncbi:SDR family oxidoreductase [Congregibacter variabilis]|uniref:SDR family oxidoreductase n=1 Tax=Congregibacter variabilis TaxID=3081200 RepID=A0ABZ0HZM6_9GAMM|nr:SDR family oxidoreductase [Congregibacter sp. IMCC43200]